MIPRSVIALQPATVIVTAGGSRQGGGEGPWSIGAAISAYAAGSGAKVAVFDVDGSAVDRTVERILEAVPAASDRVVGISIDMTRPEQVEEGVGRVREILGPVHGLVNSLGIAGPAGDATTVDLDGWAAAWEVNVTSIVNASRAAMPDLRATRGSIVNVTSTAGIRGGHHALSYPTTKAAIVGITRSMAAHHGPDGVRVNAVAPGLVYTPMVARRGMSATDRTRRAEASMLRTEGTAWNVAAPVVFLLSDAAAWITATVLPIDAGLSALVPNLGVPT